MLGVDHFQLLMNWQKTNSVHKLIEEQLPYKISQHSQALLNRTVSNLDTTTSPTTSDCTLLLKLHE